MYASVFFSLLAISPLVSGHGYLRSITIDGKSYQGNTPGSSSSTYIHINIRFSWNSD